MTTPEKTPQVSQTARFGTEMMSPRLPVVGIGASAGGLEAFKFFFERMPINSGMAFVMIPHLDPDHKSLMMEIIGRHTAMPVIQVDERMKIEPDHIYIVPPNRNLGIEEGELVPCEISRQHGINLPVDFFFRSLAAAKEEQAIAVILSGTMRDGTMGIQDIKEHGGLVIAQAPETAQHDGMPQSAIDTGMVDFVLSIKDMPDAILKFITHPYVHGETSIEDQDELNQVLAVILSRSRHDFRCYKRNTLVRRTERRMGMRQIQRMADYVEILKKDPAETDALLKDLLIGVTGFFREEQVWEKVSQDVLPKLLDQMQEDTPLRIWIPGCSTGEEAYTIAMLVHEAFEKANKHFNAQIFATDIDAEAISTARAGVYPEAIAANVRPDYLRKFFIQEDLEYHVIRRIRESVVFAAQNLVGDAPFSNLNLISCRNLLIYLNPDVQKKVIELFHFSLRENGYLILGNSETIGYQHSLFETMSKECRIYRRVGRREERMQIPIMNYSGRAQGIPGNMRMDVFRQNMSKFMQTLLLKQFAPAAILVDKNFGIINLHGPTGQYLDLPQGDPVLDLTSMVKEGLRLKLRAAVHKAMKRQESITVADARIKRDHRYCPVSFTINPVREKDMPDTLFLITFEERPMREQDLKVQPDVDLGEETLVRQLEAELLDTREDLQNTIEELETSNEELKASNEEMMSMNEELQSSNEELETSKEELQSMNEELTTVNAELQEKVRELENANNDMANLINSTDVATVFLDVHMAIRRFTPAAKHLFNLIPADVGRPIGDLAMRFSDDELQHHTSQVMATLVPSAKEVKTDEGRWFIRRILPFRTQDNRVDGLVLTFADVTDLKQNELALKKSESRLSAALAISGAGIYEHKVPIGPELYHSEQWAGMLGYTKEELPPYNRFMDWLKERMHPDDVAAVTKAYTNFIEGETAEHEVEIRMRKKSGEWIYVQGLSQAVERDSNGRATQVIGVTLDVTRFRQAQAALRENEQRFRAILDTGLFGIAITSPEKGFLDFNDAFCKLLGYARKELAGLTWPEVTHPDDLNLDLEQFNRVLAGEIRGYTIEKRYLSKDGRVIYVVLYANAVYAADASLQYLVVLVDDITERKQYETELKQSEEKFSRVFHNAPVMMAVTDLETGRILDANQQYLEVAGYTREELLGKTPLEIGLIAPADRARLIEQIKADGSFQNQELVLWPKDRRSLHCLFSCIVVEISGQPRLVSIGQDITRQKQALLRLQESERRLRQAQEMAKLGSWDWYMEQNQLVWSDEVYHIFGQDPARFKVTPQAFEQAVHPDDRQSFVDTRQHALAEAEDINVEYRILLPGGETRCVQELAEILRDERGAVVQVSGTVQDITEREQAEAALKDSEQRLRSFLENSTIIAWLKDENGRYVFISRNYEKRFSVQRQNWLGKTDSELWPPEIAEIFQQNDHAVLAAGSPIEVIEFTTDHDKKKTWWLNHKFLFRDSAGKRYVGGLGVDITERKNAEQSLRQALSEKEVLLREIHHRVKNNMQVIVGLLRMHARRTNDADLTKVFYDCRDRIEAMSLIHEALYQSDDLAHIDFETYVRKLCRNLSQAYDAWRRGIILMVERCDVEMNMDQGIAVGMVIAELVANAFKHAFPADQGGNVLVRMTGVQNDPDYIELIIADNGIGLPPDIDLQKVASLGLRLVTGIVTHELGGTIQVTNDGGTQFIIRFTGEKIKSIHHQGRNRWLPPES